MRTILGLTLVLLGCSSQPQEEALVQVRAGEIEEVQSVKWNLVEDMDLGTINGDLVNRKPTMDVGIYFPSNFDTYDREEFCPPSA